MEVKTSLSNVLKAWKESDKKGKSLLENLYGENTFKNINVTDRIKTVADAREETGRPDIDFSFMPKDLRDYFQAQYDAIVLVEALNEGEKLDWGNSNQPKWVPWFKMGSFSFRCSGYFYSTAYLGAGSRLCLKNELLSTYLAKQFPEICKNIQLK